MSDRIRVRYSGFAPALRAALLAFSSLILRSESATRTPHQIVVRSVHPPLLGGGRSARLRARYSGFALALRAALRAFSSRILRSESATRTPHQKIGRASCRGSVETYAGE